MAQKLIYWLYYILGSSGYGIIILLNIGDVKGFILFAIAVLYGLARLIFYVIKSLQERRLRELDIKDKERRFNHGGDIFT